MSSKVAFDGSRAFPRINPPQPGRCAIFEQVLLFFAGIMIATASSILGIGGGVFTVPVLYYSARHSGLFTSHVSHMAISGSLIMASTLSLSATFSNLKQKRVILRDAFLLLGGNIAGAVLGSYVAGYLDSDFLSTTFGSFILLSGLWNLYQRLPRKTGISRSTQEKVHAAETASPGNRRGILWIVPAGLLVGIVSSLTGIGGGILMVPIFTILMGETMHQAVATSSFAIIFTALSGAFGYIFPSGSSGGVQDFPGPSFGFFYIPFMIPLLLGGLLGGYLGSATGAKIESSRLKMIFSILQIAISVKILMDVFR